MPNSEKPASQLISPTHENFHWINGSRRNEPLSEFVELTRDIASGINACLQIVFASDLQRAFNAEADPGCESAPSIDRMTAESLLRLSIASSALLRKESDRHIQQLNLNNN